MIASMRPQAVTWPSAWSGAEKAALRQMQPLRLLARGDSGSIAPAKPVAVGAGDELSQGRGGEVLRIAECPPAGIRCATE